MKKILGEIIFDIKNNVVIFTILMIQLIICFSVCVFSDAIQANMNMEELVVNDNNTEKNYYKITDNLVGDYEKAFFESENYLAKLKIMYYELTHNDKFKYLEIYENPTVLYGDNIKDKSLYLYEDGQAENSRGEEEGNILNEVKCYWVSCNVQSSFDWKFKEGSLWTEDEKNNSLIPIVLGSDYAETYKLGDIIGGITPIDGKVNYQVYGILKEGNYLIHNDRMINLDRYVLLPLKDIEKIPVSKEEESSYNILYLFKINGTIQSGLSANELQSIIQEICDKSGIIPSSSVTGSTNAQSYIINESMLNILQMLKSMLTMLVVFAISTTLFYMLIKIDKNKRYYSILLLNGFSINQVRAIIFGNIIIPIILADFISCVIVSFVSVLLKLGSLPLGSMLAVNIILFLMVFIASCIKLIYIDIVSNIGGTE